MSKVEKYHMRPVTVEAIRAHMLDSDFADTVRAWCKFAFVDAETNHLVISTPDGLRDVTPTDYIVKRDGRFYVLNSPTFHAEYASFVTHEP